MGRPDFQIISRGDYALFTCSQVSWFSPVLSDVAPWTHVNATSENRQKPGLVFAGRRKPAKTSSKLDRGSDLRFDGFAGIPTPGFRCHNAVRGCYTRSIDSLSKFSDQQDSVYVWYM
jgi:hypothetical protein